MKPTLLILAAGIGSRYGGLKQVDGIGPGGEAILEYSVFDALRAGFGKIVFVIRKDIERDFREKVGKRVEAVADVGYAFQELDTGLDWISPVPTREKPWGTGHAILTAAHLVRTPFATINADDFYGADAFRILGDFLLRDCRPDLYAMVAYHLGNTLSENGAVSRGVCTVGPDGMLQDVVERTRIERSAEGIVFQDEHGARRQLAPDTLVSMNLWGFHPDIFETLETQFRDFVQANITQPRAEFYIPSVVNHQIKTRAVQLKVLSSASQWYGVTYPEDKSTVQAALRNMRDAGEYPLSLY